MLRLAYLLKGTHFIRNLSSLPRAQYRCTGSKLRVEPGRERSGGLDKLRIHERIFYGHLAHAVEMMATPRSIERDDAGALRGAGADDRPAADHSDRGRWQRSSSGTRNELRDLEQSAARAHSGAGR